LPERSYHSERRREKLIAHGKKRIKEKLIAHGKKEGRRIKE
jgi:hypothetical protein